MYCAHCGKKNSDTKLFCGFCGGPLSTPEEQEMREKEAREREIFGPPDPNRLEDTREEDDAESKIGEIFAETDDIDLREETDGDLTDAYIADVPIDLEPPIPPRPNPPIEMDDDLDIVLPDEDVSLDFDFDDAPGLPEEDDPLARPILDKPFELRAKRPPALARTEAPVVKPATVGRRKANTIVPPREMRANDIFMEGDPFDDHAEKRLSKKKQNEYGEPAKPSFFMRHVRGIVALSLFLVFILSMGIWLMSSNGQRILGQLYLSNNPTTYITLGDEAEAVESYEVAGAYFLRASDLRPTNRTYAIKAANAYILAGNNGKAATAIERLIEIDPDDVDSYVTLKALYPEAAVRPQRITALLQQGYERTGDDRLLD